MWRCRVHAAAQSLRCGTTYPAARCVVSSSLRSLSVAVRPLSADVPTSASASSPPPRAQRLRPLSTYLTPESRAAHASSPLVSSPPPPTPFISSPISPDGRLHAVQYLSFFRYVSLDEPTLQALHYQLSTLKYSLGIHGRIYLSTEGINAQMTCPVAHLDQFHQELIRMEGGVFKGVDFNMGDRHWEVIKKEEEEGGKRGKNNPPAAASAYSSSAATDIASATSSSSSSATAPHPTATPAHLIPFHTLHVRVRSRIVNDGLDADTHSKLVSHLSDPGEGLTPAQWHEEMELLARGDPKVHPHSVAIDCRNWYESEIGNFEGAIPADTNVYRQTFEVIEDIIEQKKKEVPLPAPASSSASEVTAPPTTYIFCTGGIRCVKVGAFLKSKGYEHVKFLKGGINAYAAFIKDQQRQAREGQTTLEKKREEVVKEEEEKSEAASTPSAAPSSAPTSLFKGKNFQFDSRIRGGNASYFVRVTNDVLSSCHQCGTPHDIHVNCRNPTCDALFLQCGGCATKYEHTCSEECKETVRAIEQSGMVVSSLPRKHTEFRPRVGLAASKYYLRRKPTTQGANTAVNAAATSTASRSQSASFHTSARCAAASATAPQSSAAHTITTAVPSSSTAAAAPLCSILPSCPHLSSYCVSHSTPPSSSDLLSSISSSTHSSMPERANMLSDPLVGSVLRSLIAASTAHSTASPPRLLELGTFTGYSTTWLLDALHHEQGVLISCERSEEYAAIARNNLRAHPRYAQLDLRVGPALSTLQSMVEEAAATEAKGQVTPFDFIYLDANKKSYAAYVDFILQHGLLKQSGILLVDNTLWKGLVVGEHSQEHSGVASSSAVPTPASPDSMTRSMMEFNRKLASDELLLVTMLPIRDGLTIVQHRPAQHT